MCVVENTLNVCGRNIKSLCAYLQKYSFVQKACYTCQIETWPGTLLYVYIVHDPILFYFLSIWHIEISPSLM